MPTPNHSEENVIKCPQAHSEAISKRLEFKRECTCLPNKKANQPRPRLTAPQLDCYDETAGWSSLVARWAHNPKVGGSNPPPATKRIHKVTGNWALAATVQNCPIRGTAPQFLLFIERRPVDWLAFSRGVAQLADWPCAWPESKHCRIGPWSWKHGRVA